MEVTKPLPPYVHSDIKVNPFATFTENSFYGEAWLNDKKYPFWIVQEIKNEYDPLQEDQITYQVHWFYKAVPRELRKKEEEFIEQLKQKLDDNGASK